VWAMWRAPTRLFMSSGRVKSLPSTSWRSPSKMRALGQPGRVQLDEQSARAVLRTAGL